MKNINPIEVQAEKAIRILNNYMPDQSRLIKPTLFHSMRVGGLLFEYGYSSDVVVAGFLHDCLEDTDLSEQIILDAFNQDTLDLVKANTKDPNASDRNRELIQRCRNHSSEALLIKIADVYDNYKNYVRNNNLSQIQYCSDNTELIIKYAPEKFDEKIYSDLIDFHELNKKLE